MTCTHFKTNNNQMVKMLCYILTNVNLFINCSAGLETSPTSLQVWEWKQHNTLLWRPWLICTSYCKIFLKHVSEHNSSEAFLQFRKSTVLWKSIFQQLISESKNFTKMNLKPLSSSRWKLSTREWQHEF